MTQEEKLEKAKVNMDYKEKLEKAKELYPTANADQRYVLECLFPELAESEDERIRKALIKYYSFDKDGGSHALDNITPKQIIAWLEKQGESYAKKDVDDAYLKGVCDTKQELEKQGENKQNLANSAKTCKKSQRMISAEAKEALYDKPTWSEEDDEMLDGIILRCEKYGHQEQINWLKSLKERHAWKPTEEQMRALHDMNLTGNISYVGQAQVLIELYNDLKKLTE